VGGEIKTTASGCALRSLKLAVETLCQQAAGTLRQGKANGTTEIVIGVMRGISFTGVISAFISLIQNYKLWHSIAERPFDRQA
jgi:hypothetical protein